jgi:hypothetical protein
MGKARKVPAKAKRMLRNDVKEEQNAARTPKSLKRLKPDTPGAKAGDKVQAQMMITSASKRRRPGEQHTHEMPMNQASHDANFLCRLLRDPELEFTPLLL